MNTLGELHNSQTLLALADNLLEITDWGAEEQV